jgi:hypothetical protein
MLDDLGGAVAALAVLSQAEHRYVETLNNAVLTKGYQ